MTTETEIETETLSALDEDEDVGVGWRVMTGWPGVVGTGVSAELDEEDEEDWSG